MGVKSYDVFLPGQFRDPELAAEYLTAAIEDDSPELLLIALRNIAEAHGGVGAIADATHLNRQTMVRTLTSEGNSTLSMLLATLHAVGVNLRSTAATAT